MSELTEACDEFEPCHFVDVHELALRLLQNDRRINVEYVEQNNMDPYLQREMHSIDTDLRTNGHSTRRARGFARGV